MRPGELIGLHLGARPEAALSMRMNYTPDGVGTMILDQTVILSDGYAQRVWNLPPVALSLHDLRKIHAAFAVAIEMEEARCQGQSKTS